MSITDLNIEKFIEDVFDRPGLWNSAMIGMSKSYRENIWDEIAVLHHVSKVTLKNKWKGLRDMFRVEYKRIPKDENGDLLMEPYEFQSKWIHYKSLLFLADHLRQRNAVKLEQYTFDSNEFDTNNDLMNNMMNYDDSSNGGLIEIPDVNIVEDPDPDESNNETILGTNGLPSSSTINSTTSTAAAKNRFVNNKRKLNPDDANLGNNLTSENMENMDDKDDDYHFLMSLHPYLVLLEPAQKLRTRMKFLKIVFKELYNESAEPDDEN